MNEIAAARGISPRLVFEVALVSLGWEPEGEMWTRHGLDEAGFGVLMASEGFREEVSKMTVALAQSGQVESLIARMAVRSSVLSVYRMVMDERVRADTRLSAFRSLMQLGGLDGGASAEKGSGSSFTLSIAFGADGEARPVLEASGRSVSASPVPTVVTDG